MNLPREEYPRPQMVRESWENLNGPWKFEFDFGRSGRERGLQNQALSREILVPFCPESELSGIGYKDFMNAVWYRREFELKNVYPNQRVLLRFEAVDHFCQVWVNGESVGTHTGGYTPFCFDITDNVHAGRNTLSVCAEDDPRGPMQPRGKQSEEFFSHGCDYTRVTGIWQTVWLEYVPQTYLRDYRVETDIDNGAVTFEARTNQSPAKKTLSATVSYHGKTVGGAVREISGDCLRFTVALEETHLWEPLAPELYDVEFSLEADDGSKDTVRGYFGLRNVTLGEKAILINGKPVFQRLVLDQGFYRDGIYTAPSDEALKRDIQLSMDIGFNGARLHQKVFERRFLYWADQLGYLVWGEYGNWGLDHSDPRALEAILEPWIEAVERDYNSPALIGWCPFNETWDYQGRAQDDAVLRGVYRVTKALDHTRPVIDTSGNFHVVTDLYDVHDYEQDVEKFAAHYEPMKEGGPPYENYGERQRYGGQPYFVSEYGGILWNDREEAGWGYGTAPKTMEEFTARYIGLTETLLKNPGICGLCYTQLYDIEQEKNGLYTYDRERKFPAELLARMRDAMTQQAAIEGRSEEGNGGKENTGGPL